MSRGANLASGYQDTEKGVFCLCITPESIVLNTWSQLLAMGAVGKFLPFSEPRHPHLQGGTERSLPCATVAQNGCEGGPDAITNSCKWIL